ncbi:MAG: protein-L-isoaspartate(D-aspartate) O-methyltransferase [Xanthobacteraceae bacterium]|nr:protein-L-isoaspartate(D-aspartate) O-methyltransferase [Xanthobacteraceae bacterium]MBX3535755.1 protein-L-isoaspartate(D-aspartate) O-methyltransferase [Xanthobacteraceae bacterium]MBX3547813.1 protein-L-isoaspartate(D-aspartate) O-methyltransferase [Xanthobacteraceae bacterium]MCW5677109.1 protein-L-isoaspartate(D-aspartate) O-methyltransferase [Xanthobacteraceae bacterium]
MADRNRRDEEFERKNAEARMEFLLSMRRRGIRDVKVLRALEQVPREIFVEAEHAGVAYADQALPIDCGQTISQPFVVATMTEALDVEPSNKVLEIGTGSGYQAAVLGMLAKSVVTIERYRTLADLASARLRVLGLKNVTVRVADGSFGAPDEAPFDRIVVTAATPEVPPALFDQLANNGRMIAPVGPVAGVQALRLFTKSGSKVEHLDLMSVRFVPLVEGKAQAL